jgi:E3 SUMO-protein ligase PIAS1
VLKLVLSFSSRYTPSNRVTSAMASTSHGVYDPPKPNAFTQNVASGVAHYDPYAPPRRPATVAAPVASSSSVKALRVSNVGFFL